MCAGSDDRLQFASLLRDPLIRLVMDSDGVTEQEMIAVYGSTPPRPDSARRSHAVAVKSARLCWHPAMRSRTNRHR